MGERDKPITKLVWWEKVLIEHFRKPQGERAARSAQSALISKTAYHVFAVMPYVRAAGGDWWDTDIVGRITDEKTEIVDDE